MVDVSSGIATGLRELLRGRDGRLLVLLGGATALAPLGCLVVGRVRRWPLIVVLPALLASMSMMTLATLWFRPDLVRAYLRVAAAVAGPFELGFVAWVVWAACGTVKGLADVRAEPDVHERIHSAVRRAAGPGRFSALVAGELSTLYYGLFCWRARPRGAPGQLAIAYRHSGGYGVALPALIALVALETTLVHLLIGGFAPRAAWLLTVLGVYSIVWLVADHRATLLRPILVDGESLHVKAGLRWSGRLPLARIAAVRCLADDAPLARDVRSLTLYGRPQLILTLDQPATLERFLGLTATSSAIGLSVDDWPTLRRALQSASVPIEGDLTRAPADFYERLRDGLRGWMRRRAAADAIARELALLACAVYFWGIAPSAPGPDGRAFTIHRRSNYFTIFGVLLGLSLVEMTAVHLFLRHTSVSAANVVLFLSAYGVVWFFGDLHALRLRPVIVDRDRLCLRVGVRREVHIPLCDIAALEELPPSGEPPRRGGDYARCTAFGPPDLLVRLRRPAELEQMIGKPRAVSCIGVKIDDQPAFRELVLRNLPAV